MQFGTFQDHFNDFTKFQGIQNILDAVGDLCIGNATFKSQRHGVGYQSNQKLLHHYQNGKNQLNL